MKFIKVFIKSVKSFFDDDPMTYAASIAFYTVVSLPGILLLAINGLSQLYERDQVRSNILEQLNAYLGPTTVRQAENILENASISYDGLLPQIIGWSVLLFSATTVFISLQTSINNIWKVKRDPNSPLLRLLLDRLWSFATIVSIGFVLLVSLVIDSLLSFVVEYIETSLSYTHSVVAATSSILLSLMVTTLIFLLVFKVLPDVKTQWKNVWVGALFSAVLFLGGKFIIGLYLNNVAIGNAYGASGSLVVFLTWVYYSSLIVLFGAKFTFEYTLESESNLKALEFSQFVKEKVIDDEALNKNDIKNERE